MILDVQEILKADGAKIPVKCEIEPSAELLKSDMTFSEVLFSGELENIGGVLELRGDVKGKFTVPCARCMKETEQSFEAEVFETLAKEDAEISDRDAIIPFAGTSVDLGEAVWPSIVLTLDSKYLCQPECKGLCIHCGADLNESPCDCKDDDIDPRLAGLADLLQ
ncbi:MAG: DUF177 domain-containing protein [Clostridia bacterium]|nr:DUF177 domain-containing protein [Clostridia bacterium]